MRKLLIGGLTWVLLFGLDVPAAVVSTCDDASLRAAVSQGGLVTFGCSGTIVLTQAITVTTNVVLNGVGALVTISGNDQVQLFNVSPDVEFQIANLRLTRGVAPYGGAISNSSGTVILSGVTLTSNGASNSFVAFPRAGGAIYSHSGTIHASGCNFLSNYVYAINGAGSANPARGGAIGIEGGLLELVDCLFESNTAKGGPGNAPIFPPSPASLGADASGAAVYSDRTASVQRCRFLSNAAWGGNGVGGTTFFNLPSGGPGGSVYGGVIHNVGALKISQCTFMNNTANGGPGGVGVNAASFGGAGGSGGPGGDVRGAVIFNGGELVVEDCTFDSNIGNGGNPGTPGYGVEGGASGTGGTGGSALGGAIFGTNVSYITNCTVVANTLTAGDGLSGAAGTSCLLSGCSGGAGGSGGNGGSAGGAGVYHAGGTGAIVHCTFEGNSIHAGTNGLGAPGGSGRLGGQSGRPGVNGAPGAALGGAVGISSGNVQVANSILSHSQGSTNCFGSLQDLGVNICSDSSSGFTNPVSIKNMDAGLGTLTDNGGPTRTVAPLSTSPAVDGGNNAFAPHKDQRGVPRPQGRRCDIGAYELGQLQIEKSDGGVAMKYGAPPGQLWRLHGRANSESWRDLGGRTADADGYVRYGPILPTARVELFRTFKP